VTDLPDPRVSPPELDGGGDVERVSLFAQQVPAVVLAAGAVVALGLGLVVGLRVGKALGAARLGPVSKVEPIFVERCHDCEQRAAAAQTPVTAAEVAAMVAAQERVEHAA
jgi:hypothetical protein